MCASSSQSQSSKTFALSGPFGGLFLRLRRECRLFLNLNALCAKGYIADMKFNQILTYVLGGGAAVLSQACLPLVPVDEGDRTTEEIFSFRNESGRDVRACVYFYEKTFTPQERDLMDLQVEVAALEDELREDASKPAGESDAARVSALNSRLELKRKEYLDL